jgi:hypothetical protein
MKYDPTQLLELLKDPDWTDIGNLPSNFYPYTFGALYIKPFTVKHLRLLSKAVVTKDVSLQIRAVDLVISQSVFELTIGDYYYVLEWLKIHSTTKTPLTVEWHCQDQRLQHKETFEFISNDPKTLTLIASELKSDEYDLVPCATHNTEMLHLVNLAILQLPEVGWDGIPEGYDFPRVAQLKGIQEALKDPELNMIVGAAQWVSASPKVGAEYATIEDKIEMLESQSNLDMFTTAMAINDTIVHGIAQNSILHCRTCRSEHPYEIQIDSVSFFQ